MRNLILILGLTLLSMSGQTQEPAAPSALTLLTENWPPVTYEENGDAKGMAVDLVQEIQKITKDTAGIQVFPWARAFSLVQSQPNVVLFTVARTKEREQLFTMLGPIASGEIALFQKSTSGPTINSLADAKKANAIAAHRGTVFESRLEKEGFKNLLATNSPMQNAQLLMKDRVDLICEDTLTVKEIFRVAKQDMSLVKKVYAVEKYDLYIAFSKGTSSDVVESWRAALVLLKKNGVYERIYHKWLPGEKAPSGVHLAGVVPGTPVETAKVVSGSALVWPSVSIGASAPNPASWRPSGPPDTKYLGTATTN